MAESLAQDFRGLVTFFRATSRYQVEEVVCMTTSKGEKQMTRLAIFANLLIWGIVPHLTAAECSNADFRGIYSFVGSGTLGSAAFATAGQTTYDGKGGVTGLIQISLNGAVTPLLAWSGTYTVDPNNCTATKTAHIPGVGTVHFFVTAGDDFRELRFIATDTGTAITGTARKQ
jgi:hypothetical protein